MTTTTRTNDEDGRTKMSAIEDGLPGTGGAGGRAALALLLAATAGIAACREDAGAGSPSPGQSAQASARIVNVEVEEVRPRDFTRTVRLTGVVQARRDVLVSAEESGVVRRIVRDKGGAVRAGQAIVRLDDGILAAQVRTALAQAELAREVWERRKRLYEEDEVGSEMSYLEAKYAAEQADGSLVALEERLARTTIVAPVSGLLEDRMVEVGAMVSPGTPVARIVQVDTVKILAGVPERYALDVAPGAATSVSFDVLEGESFEGKIEYVGATVDSENRTFPVELVLPNPNGVIKPEMIAQITVVRRQVPDAVVVPQQALVSMEEGYVVFVVDGSGDDATAQERRVEVLTAQGNEVVLESGLQAGERLVVVGQQGLTAGDKVRVVASARASEAGAP